MHEFDADRRSRYTWLGVLLLLERQRMTTKGVVVVVVVVAVKFGYLGVLGMSAGAGARPDVGTVGLSDYPSRRCFGWLNDWHCAWFWIYVYLFVCCCRTAQ